ncbi:MAG: hypothetical protein ABSB97_03680 [Thermoplasmata archaeon]|jgi:hypothetical protein
MTATTTTQTQVVYRQDSEEGELPILVGILAVLVALFGIFLLFIGGLRLLSGLGLLTYPSNYAFGVMGGNTVLSGAITIIFGCVFVSVASGLWDLETWALYLTGIVTAIVIGVLLWTASYGIALVVAAVLLVYLIAVRKHFY